MAWLLLAKPVGSPGVERDAVIAEHVELRPFQITVRP
jgi:hypothetical protein